MKAYLQWLGSGLYGCPPSLLVFFDSCRYLFNVGDGMQRFCMEHKIKLPKLEHMFLTSLHPQSVGGLPGMMMTLADTDHSGVHLYGPRGLDSMVAGWRGLSRSGTRAILGSHELLGGAASESGTSGHGSSSCAESGELVISDERLTLKSFVVPVRAAAGGTGPGVAEEPASKRLRTDDVESAGAGSAAAVDLSSSSIPPNFIERSAVCYIGTTCSTPGKFNPTRAQELGVPAGPLFGRLQRGEDVQINGVTIHSSDCVSVSTPGISFCVIDCPSTTALPALLTDTSLREAAAPVTLVYHCTRSDVMQDELYQQWMTSTFGPSTTHVSLMEKAGVDSTADTPSGLFCPYQAAARTHIWLHGVFPRYFPPLPCMTESSSISPVVVSSSHVTMQPLLKYVMAPVRAVGFDRNEVLLVPNPTDILDTFWKTYPDARTAYLRDQETNPVHQPQSHGTQDTPTGTIESIRFLGTGSAVPSKYRNVSAILVRFRPGGAPGAAPMPSWIPMPRMMWYQAQKPCLLMDCGEGTLGQLEFAYGCCESVELLSGMHVCMISHPHADHYLGLPALLCRREQVAPRADPMVIIGPPPLLRFLEMFSQNCWPLRYWFISTAALVHHSGEQGKLSPQCSDHLPSDSMRDATTFAPDIPLVLHGMCLAYGVTSLRAIRVRHCPHACGFVVQCFAGGPVVYSGDTLPSEGLEKAGQGAELLIHEATFEDELEDEAQEKMHSTISQAVRSGNAMGAACTVLTHFSQRYPKICVVDNAMRAGVAFDLMELGWSDKMDIASMLNLLRLMFPEEKDE